MFTFWPVILKSQVKLIFKIAFVANNPKLTKNNQSSQSLRGTVKQRMYV